MRIAFVFGSIPTRNDQETDLHQAVVEKKDWLGQEAESVSEVLKRRHPGSAVSVHLMYSWTSQLMVNDVEWFATRPHTLMTNRYFYQGKQWSGKWIRKVLDWEPDLVHWQMNSYAYTFHMASKAFVKHGVPYVYQHHGPHLARKPWVRMILRYPNRHAARGIYLTHDHELAYRTGLGLDVEKSAIIPVGYDEKFKVMDQQEARDESGFQGDPILFWCGGLSERKDPITILRAYDLVVSSFPKSHMYIIGYGPLDDIVRNFISSHTNLQNNVTMLGYVNNSRIPAMVNAADIFVLGSWGEGFSIASMEAMACGVLPIVTTLPCFKEQTDNGRYGLLFEPGNVEKCASHMRKAMGDVEYRREIRQQLPEVMKRFSWSYAAEQLVNLYEDVLDTGDKNSIK